MACWVISTYSMIDTDTLEHRGTAGYGLAPLEGSRDTHTGGQRVYRADGGPRLQEQILGNIWSAVHLIKNVAICKCGILSHCFFLGKFLNF